MLTLARSHAHRRTGRRPRTQAEFARAMENMGETLLVNAIFGGGSPIVPGTSYEVREGETGRYKCMCVIGERKTVRERESK